MKWFILICLIVGTKLTESRNIFKRDADHSHRKIADVHKEIGHDVFKSITLVMLSQNLQKCSFEEHKKVVEKIHDFAEHCEQHPEDEECGKTLTTLLYDAICAITDVKTHYEWTEGCCGNADPERGKCFSEKRHVDLEPYKRPTSEEVCKNFKEDPESLLGHYIVEFSKRHENMYCPAILGLTQDYQRILAACCEAEDKDQCFKERMTQHKKVASYLDAKQTETCHIVRDYSVRTFHAIKLAQVTQKYPRATFAMANKLAEKLVHLHQDCCKGEAMECMIERLDLTKYTCEHSEEISAEMGDICCKKPLLEQVNCIIHLVNEKTPENLPPIEQEFIENPEICKRLAEEKDGLLASFLYEVARRHIDLSAIQDVATANIYSQKLPLCCKESDAHECLKDLSTMLEKHIEKSKNLLKTNCDAQQQLGDYPFTRVLLARYVKKMPQVTPKTLAEIAMAMADVGKKCCGHDEIQKMPCADELLSFIIGRMCEKQKETFINKNVKDCCEGYYTDRRKCFTDLGADPTYVPPEVDDNTFQFKASMCTASPEELPKLKLELLASLLKIKPNLDNEKVPQISEAFQKMFDKCCAAADQQKCLDEEKPIVIDHCRQMIEH